jgi:hypothetical protein
MIPQKNPGPARAATAVGFVDSVISYLLSRADFSTDVPFSVNVQILRRHNRASIALLQLLQ